MTVGAGKSKVFSLDQQGRVNAVLWVWKPSEVRIPPSQGTLRIFLLGPSTD